MKLIYIDKKKGLFYITLGFIPLLIYFITIIVLNIVGMLNPEIYNIINRIQLNFIGNNFGFFELYPLFIIFLILMILDGYIEGIIENVIAVVCIVLFLILIQTTGGIHIALNINELAIQMDIDISLIVTIIFLVYLWKLFCETIIYAIKSDLFTKYVNITEDNIGINDFEENEIKVIRKTDEVYKDHKWIERENENIVLDPEEIPVFNDWVELRGEFQDNFIQFYIWNTFNLIILSSIYAFITFYLEEMGNPPPYNNTIEAFFFFIWFVLAQSISSPRKYIRAVLYVLITIIIEVILFNYHVINSEGIIILSYIIPIFKIFLIDLSQYYNSLNIFQMFTTLSQYLGIVLITLFIILIINTLIKKLKGFPKFQIFITTKNLYIRAERKFSDYSIFTTLWFVLLNTFNPRNYRELIRILRYKRTAAKESWKWDYGKLNYSESIKKLEKTEVLSLISIIKSIILILVGFFTINYYFGYILIFMGLLRLIKTQKEVHNIIIEFRRSKSNGSLFRLNREKTLRLYKIPDKIAAAIPSIQFYEKLNTLEKIKRKISPRSI